MKALFKNIGVLLIFVGLLPFVGMFYDGFDSDLISIGLFFLVIGITLFFVNRE